MAEDIDIHPVRESEFAAAGEATAQAYREFQRPEWPGYTAYVARIADIAERAQVATVLVAVVDGVVAGSATLELTERIQPEQHGTAGAGRGAPPDARREPRVIVDVGSPGGW